MSEQKLSVSAEGSQADYERLIYIHTLKVAQAKTPAESLEARRSLAAIQRSAKLARHGKPPPKLAPSMRERVEAAVKGEPEPLRPDQLLTDEELRRRYGTGEACSACGTETWDVGEGPQCGCGALGVEPF